MSSTELKKELLEADKRLSQEVKHTPWPALTALSTTVNKFGPTSACFRVELPSSQALNIRSTTYNSEADREQLINWYYGLYSRKENVEKYGDMSPKTLDWAVKRVEMYHSRWQKGDPLSGFAVLLDDKFIGHVAFGYHGKTIKRKSNSEINPSSGQKNEETYEKETPGCSEMGFIFHKEQWGKGYGFNAVAAVLQFHKLKETAVNGVKLGRLIATASPENIASRHILEKLGMHPVARIFSNEFSTGKVLYKGKV